MTEQTREYARRFKRDEDRPNFSDDPLVRDMLLRLDKLERQTDHQHQDSENDKDALANKALRIASELGAYVSGWAVDHKIGLAIEGLGNIPDLGIQTRTPAYNQLRASVNSHRHEAAGRGRSTDLASRVQRRALSSLFNAMTSGVRESLYDPLAEALEALEYGETLPILEPVKDGRKRKFRELKLQLRALCYIEYMQVLAAPKNQLQSKVKEAFGVSESTVRGWERQLPTQLDPFHVENALSRAKRCGEADRANGSMHFERIWGLTALSEWGVEYKAIQGFNQTKSDYD
jgi:hypothetical protein